MIQGRFESWLRRLSSLGLLARITGLTVVVLLAYCCLLPLVHALGGHSFAAQSLTYAAVCCWLTGALTLVVLWFLPTKNILVHMGVATALRSAPPLIVGLYVYSRGGVFPDAGFAYHLVLFYMVVLFFETVLLAGQSLPQKALTADSLSVDRPEVL